MTLDDIPVGRFGLSARLRHVLSTADVQTLGDLEDLPADWSDCPSIENALSRLPNCGRVSIRELKTELLALRDRLARVGNVRRYLTDNLTYD